MNAKQLEVVGLDARLRRVAASRTAVDATLGEIHGVIKQATSWRPWVRSHPVASALAALGGGLLVARLLTAGGRGGGGGGGGGALFRFAGTALGGLFRFVVPLLAERATSLVQEWLENRRGGDDAAS